MAHTGAELLGSWHPQSRATSTWASYTRCLPLGRSYRLAIRRPGLCSPIHTCNLNGTVSTSSILRHCSCRQPYRRHLGAAASLVSLHLPGRQWVGSPPLQGAPLLGCTLHLSSPTTSPRHLPCMLLPFTLPHRSPCLHSSPLHLASTGHSMGNLPAWVGRKWVEHTQDLHLESTLTHLE